MTGSRDHAVAASQLLANLEGLAERLANLTPEDRLQMAATGGFTRVNADQQWTRDLAVAHALAAIALHLTDPPLLPDPSGAGWQE